MLQREVSTWTEFHLLCTLMHRLTTRIICTDQVARHVQEKPVLLLLLQQPNNKNLSVG
jgi:hypothetical protein